MSADDERPLATRLSIVIAAWTGGDELHRCLRSLGSQIDAADDEIIVARNFRGEPGAALLPAGTPVRDIVLAGATVPRLRAAGLAAASGTVVAFLEDHCVCAPGWRAAIVEGHDARVVGVGGPVDLAPGGSPLDWAVYFYDYARFAPPMRPEYADSLSGANMSWTRSFLSSLGSLLRDEVRETAVTRECRLRGLAMRRSPAAIVTHGKRNTAGRAVRLAFALARGYASDRAARTGLIRRLAMAGATVLLPALLAGRIVAATLRSRRHVARLVAASPWLIVLLASWSLGEAVGYAAGAGASHLQWR